MNHLYSNLKNNIDFFLRSHITISRKNYTEKAVNTDCVFKNHEQKNLYCLLKEKYDLNPLYQYNEINFLTNLYYIDIFDKYLKPENKSVSVLDIGSKNWNYAGSEYIFFKRTSEKLLLNGIELDAYRLCTNLFNRYEIAKFYIKSFKNTNYIADDFMNHNMQYDYIIWILPFITEYPLLKWGLPLKYFKPQKMLEHALNLLKDEGKMFIINQGENEFNIQKKLNNKLQINCNYIGEIDNVFSPFKNRRFCSIVSKH